MIGKKYDGTGPKGKLTNLDRPYRILKITIDFPGL